MTPPLHAAEPPEVVFRCGRHPDPWAWPDWSYAAEDGTFGNRFDDPDGEYRVLYASSERQAAFRECLARFRPDPAVVAARIDDEDDDAPATAAAGTIPAAWLENRRMGTARLNGSFCDIGHSNSLEYLRTHMAARLLEYELDDLDAGDIRARAPRRLTQEISRCVFVQARDDGSATFAGIRYASRLGDELTNWAIFEPNEPIDMDAEQVDPDDPDLLERLDRLQPAGRQRLAPFPAPSTARPVGVGVLSLPAWSKAPRRSSGPGPALVQAVIVRPPDGPA